MRSLSGFGAATPDLDFFLNTCSTYTALGIDVVYAARYVVTLMILHELHDLPRQAFAKRSCSFWHVSVLRIKERGSEDVLHVLWHGPQVLSTAPDEVERFALCRVHWGEYSIVAISPQVVRCFWRGVWTWRGEDALAERAWAMQPAAVKAYNI
jgi:hypothetical protein